MKTYYADPDSDLDYSINWAEKAPGSCAWLQPGEELGVSSWLVSEGDDTKVVFGQSGIVDKEEPQDIDDESDPVILHSNAVAYSWIGFNEANDGDEFVITNRVETTNVPSRKEDQSFRVVIRQR